MGHPWYIFVNSSSERESQERDSTTQAYETVAARVVRAFPPGAPIQTAMSSRLLVYATLIVSRSSRAKMSLGIIAWTP